MNWEAVAAIGELTGALAVVASLIYLAIQVRQNTNASKAATVQDMTNKWVQINLWAAEDPDRTFNILDADPGSREYLQGLAWYRALFHQWSNNYYQYQRGVLEEDAFIPTKREILYLLSRPHVGDNFRLAWTSAKHIYSDGFGRFFESLIAESEQRDDA